MAKLADLESEDLRLIGILNQIRRLLGHVGSTSPPKTRDDAALEIYNLTTLALRIVQDEKIKIESDRKLLKDFESETRQMLRNLEMAE